ncbi:hypothetical protein AS160_10205 [Marinitoga sp. 38H-ov]|nr:hypothetical protein AS160_10205 [Marinitoga sp. 38H-ov]
MFFYWYMISSFLTSKIIFTFKYPSIISLKFLLTCIMIIIIAVIREKYIETKKKKRKFKNFIISIFLYGVVFYIYGYFLYFTYRQFINIWSFKFIMDYFVYTIDLPKKINN